MSEIDFTSMEDFLAEFGFAGATSGADIVRILGEQQGTAISAADQERFGVQLDELLKTTRGGLGDLPGLLSTLTGQAEETAGIGRGAALGARTLGAGTARERLESGVGAAETRFGVGGEAVRESFLTGQRGLQRTALGLGRESRELAARSGFAGGGAVERRRGAGRRDIGRQLTEIAGMKRRGLGQLGTERAESIQNLENIFGLSLRGVGEQFRTTTAGIEDVLGKARFGAGQEVLGDEAGFLATLLGGIGELRETLRIEGVFDPTVLTGGGTTSTGGAGTGLAGTDILAEERFFEDAEEEEFRF